MYFAKFNHAEPKKSKNQATETKAKGKYPQTF